MSKQTESWPTVGFSELFDDHTGGNVKIQTSDYLSEGLLPVIDQGSNYISGYVNDAQLACSAPLPCILFGDHTRRFKYVEEPFALGADGVKVLVPSNRLDPRYAYHALKRIQLPGDLGYSRHFKYLKRSFLHLPPLDEQRQIASVLDKMESIRQKRERLISGLDRLAESIFIELFSDLSNPNWKDVELKDVADICTGYAFRSESYSSANESVKLCRGANVLPKQMDWTDLARWPSNRIEGEIPQEYKLFPGDIVMAMDRPWISSGFKIAQISQEDCPCLLVQRVARLRGVGGVPNSFLFWMLNLPAFTRHCRPTETTIPHISPKEIRAFKFRLPPSNLLEEFDSRIQLVERLRGSYMASNKQISKLIDCLLDEIFHHKRSIVSVSVDASLCAIPQKF
jgi:type I restriction enzyme S subunit